MDYYIDRNSLIMTLSTFAIYVVEGKCDSQLTTKEKDMNLFTLVSLEGWGGE